uniref:Uncharacterized protein n=1 Tax=Anguilla anguilla TaxID=7936 RepID=A0A0E9WMI1_ANGAN
MLSFVKKYTHLNQGCYMVPLLIHQHSSSEMKTTQLLKVQVKVFTKLSHSLQKQEPSFQLDSDS